MRQHRPARAAATHQSRRVEHITITLCVLWIERITVKLRHKKPLCRLYDFQWSRFDEFKYHTNSISWASKLTLSIVNIMVALGVSCDGNFTVLVQMIDSPFHKILYSETTFQDLCQKTPALHCSTTENTKLQTGGHTTHKTNDRRQN